MTKLQKKFYSIQKTKMKCHKILSSYGLNGKIGAFGAARSGPILAVNYGIDKALKYLFDVIFKSE